MTPEEPRQSFGTKLQEWTLRHQAFHHRQQQMRQEKENQEMEKCTFRPSINGKSEFYARRSRGCFLEPLAERLHHEADKRETMRNKAKELLEADDMCSCTFRPQINRPSSAKDAGRAPIHQRTEVIQQVKQERIRAVQSAEDRRSECSFQPRISSRSERMVQRKRDRLYRALSQGDGSCLRQLGPVEERLYAAAAEQRRHSRADSLSEPSQSAPSVDEASRRICKSSIYFQGAQQDFLTRQQTFELAKQRRMEVRANHAEAECSFRPRISETSRYMVSGNLDLVGETPDDRVNRLAVKDVARRDRLRDTLQQLQYRDCTFRPEVNSVSQMLVSRLDEAASTDSGAEVHERLYRSALNKSKASDNSHGEEYSFRPQVDAKVARRFSHLKPRYACSGTGVMENIREEAERKRDLLLERRREMEEKQLEGCTFAPETCKAYEEPQRPVVVSGLGRFFELRGLAQRQQQEQQEREERLFRPEACGTRGAGVTIPEPFELSSGSRQGAPRAGREREAQPPRECTFAPHTQASENREILRQMMSSPLVC